MGEGLLTGLGMTLRRLHHQSPPSKVVTTHKAGNLEFTTLSAGSSTGWSLAFPDVRVGLTLPQAALV